MKGGKRINKILLTFILLIFLSCIILPANNTNANQDEGPVTISFKPIYTPPPSPPSPGTGYSPPPNIPPYANITGPNIAYKNQNLIFSAYHSIDYDGYIVGYRWDFENDGIFDTPWLEDFIIEHNYSKVGNYTILLEVKDNFGAVSTASHNITIIELIPPLQLPIANINGPYFGYANESILFTSKGSYDPDGVIINYSWDFGDDYISYEENPEHLYEKPGRYTVILKVTDNDNLTNLSTTKAVIIEKDEKIIIERELPSTLLSLIILPIISAFIVVILVKRRELRNLKEKTQKLENKLVKSSERNRVYRKAIFERKSQYDNINRIVDNILNTKYR